MEKAELHGSQNVSEIERVKVQSVNHNYHCKHNQR